MSRKRESNRRHGAPASTPRRRYVRATRWRRRRFFALLEETGQVKLAAELSGLGLGCIYKLRRVERGFAERMIEARVSASGRLAAEERPAEGPGAEQGDGLVVRRGRLPGFAAAWEQALAEAPPHLESRIIAEGLRRIDPERWEEPGEDVPFDAATAIRIAGWLDRRARRR